MSGSSDSEEFFDAEDDTFHHSARKSKQRDSISIEIQNKDTSESTTKVDDDVFVKPAQPKPIVEPKEHVTIECIVNKDKNEEDGKESSADKNIGRRRFRELRQRMQTEDDDIQINSSPPDSQTSSIEGVYPTPSKTTHPFRIIEHDTLSLQSMTSLGRVGRILAGVGDNVSATLAPNVTQCPSSAILTRESQMSSIASIPSKDEDTASEPDVIASTKTNGKSNEDVTMTGIPVAPPRRKKKPKVQTPSDLAPSTTESALSASPLPSPASTIESITREFEHSLDIRSATKGQYVVKPQDEDKSKAEGPSTEELERVEKMKAELMSVRSSDKSSSPLGSMSNNSIGRYSLGPHKLPGLSPQGSKERRKSADSGKRLTDMEILEQVTVLNLDTGERVPLSIAEDKLPQCINPLSLHIMRLTSEYISNSSLEKEKESDEESVDSKMSSIPPDEDVSVGRVRKKTQKLKRFLGSTVKKTMDKAKSIAQEVSHARHKEDVMDIVDEVYPGEQQYIKLKASNSHKGPYEFSCLQHVQDLSGEHVGPVWCMKFSVCGRLLATAGQDRVLRIWVLRDAFAYFQDTRTKYNAEKVSPTPSQESLVSQQSMEDPHVVASAFSEIEGTKSPFMPKPFCTYTGHTSDLLDVSWSKNYFVLSSSMDKTVRLWHISRKECLCCFQHIDFVTAIVFHPRDDRYFLSGSLDGKLRLWNIPDKKVAVWNEVDGQTKLITAANFCQNGKFAVVGSYDGRCIFYNTDQLKYHTQIHVRSTRGKNSTGRKISGIEPMPGEDKILVTSNDSRIRLYDLRDLNLSCKYKGYVNVSSQIKASFSPDGQYIVSGSENQCIYIWKTHHDYSKFSSVRRDRNDFWEGIKAHNAVVTCAVFAPNPDSIIKQIEEREQWEGKEDGKNLGGSTVDVPPVDPVVEQRTKGCGGHVLVSADFNGYIKVFLNKTKPKHSSLPASALA
ncbi:WD repeat-containing protein 44 [Eufriesea mexicana]|uniref:WD repeat-containing protein 44 n=1 Tax=Eufriesea mexicana TaxID=516756 RepID=A0A310SST0_9HYME|nr:WD repeat-containing protein 44 [Eufriesea mexicana]